MVPIRTPLAGETMAIPLNSPKKSRTLLPIAIAGAITLLVALYCYCFSISTPTNQCHQMLAKLTKTVDPAALQEAVAHLVERYPAGPSRLLTDNELPQVLRRTMSSLVLGEARIGDGANSTQRVLSMVAPGGFASYGIVIGPPGVVLTVSTNRPGLTVLRWGQGIYVFYFTS